MNGSKNELAENQKVIYQTCSINLDVYVKYISLNIASDKFL